MLPDDVEAPEWNGKLARFGDASEVRELNARCDGESWTVAQKSAAGKSPSTLTPGAPHRLQTRWPRWPRSMQRVSNRIKMELTSRVERVLRLNAEIREQRDAIAALRAEWAKLDAPMRLQGLAERHLGLKPLNATQYDQLKNLPERPPAFARPGAPDPIGAMINTIEAAADAPPTTGSVPAPGDQQ